MTTENSEELSSLTEEGERIKLLGKYFKSASGLFTTLAATFPLSGILVSAIVPVWAGAPYLASIGSFLAVAFLFFSSRGKDSSVIRHQGRLSLFFGVGLLSAYFILNWLCIFNHDGARVVTGFVLSSEAQTRASNGAALSLARQDLLASFGYDHAELIWLDVRLVDVILNATFIVGTISTTLSVFSFVLINIANERPNKAVNPSGGSGGF